MLKSKPKLRKFVLSCLVFTGVVLGVLALLIGAIFIDNFQYETDKYDRYECDPHLIWEQDSRYLRAYKKTEENEGIYKLEYQKLKGVSTKKMVGVKCKNIGSIFESYGRSIVLVNKESGFSIWDDWTIDRISIYNDIRHIESSSDDELKSAIAKIINDYYCGINIGNSFENIKDTKTTYELEISFNEEKTVVWKTEVVVKDSDRGRGVYIRLDKYESYTNVQSEYITVPQGTVVYQYVLELIEK